MIFSHLWDIRHTSSQPHRLRREVKATLLPPPPQFFSQILLSCIYMQKLLSCMYIQKLLSCTYICRNYFHVCIYRNYVVSGSGHIKVTRIMDVVPDTDLDNFMENLGISESEEGVTGAASTHTTVSTSGKLQEPQCDDIWRDVTDVLNNWSQQILDAVSKCYSWAGNFQQTINELLKESNWTVFLPITI